MASEQNKIRTQVDVNVSTAPLNKTQKIYSIIDKQQHMHFFTFNTVLV